MSTIGRIIGAILRPITERQAGQRSFAELAEALEDSGEKLRARLASVPDTPANREALNHIIGIERWGQRRLRVGLGEPFVSDGYRGYRLPENTALDDLRRAFAETRQQTVALARALAAAGGDPARKVRHNDLGELSLRGWLVYLAAHASREGLRLRGNSANPPG